MLLSWEFIIWLEAGGRVLVGPGLGSDEYRLLISRLERYSSTSLCFGAGSRGDTERDDLDFLFIIIIGLLC